MRSILCYGDSNTWGSVPASDTERYGPDVRWPRVMAAQLGHEYEVYEAGLGGRTTVFDRLPRGYRSGKELIVPTMDTNSPLDLVIILLGTNDVSMPHVAVSDIVAGASELISIVRRGWEFGPNSDHTPQPLLVGPPLVGTLSPEDLIDSPGSVEKSHQLGPAYAQLASELSCPFVDLAPHVDPSPRDAFHWEPEGHAAAARVIGDKVRDLYK